jgi:riboflavin synthase
MFSGIIDHMGTVLEVQDTQAGKTLRIGTSFEGLSEGESIAVDGVCLTVIRPSKNSFDVDISPETLRLTLARTYVSGSRVNLERSLALGDRVGGHFVSGHVDQTMILSRCSVFSEFTELSFEGALSLAQGYRHLKGSVTVNGVSLTVNGVNPGGFEVMLIPHTLERTNLSQLRIGSEVNVEWDSFAKMVSDEIRRLLPVILKERGER